MKIFIQLIFFIFISTTAFTQSHQPLEIKSTENKFYFYWGWNSSRYTNSDISFKGDHYDFKLANVVAKDRQSKFSFDTYLNPSKITIPQFNFRLGYYFKNNWDLSIGMDHMKYVVQQNQTVNIHGTIENTHSNYDGIYSGEDILITDGFLEFEHTDGLNYANLELRHSSELFHFKNLEMKFIKGAGVGVLVPRTNVTLFNNDRYDEFHLSGYGISLIGGLNVTFYDKFFIQSELKGGFIGLPDVRTTISTTDRASQHFFFSQLNIVFGGIIHLNWSKNN